MFMQFQQGTFAFTKIFEKVKMKTAVLLLKKKQEDFVPKKKALTWSSCANFETFLNPQRIWTHSLWYQVFGDTWTKMPNQNAE